MLYVYLYKHVYSLGIVTGKIYIPSAYFLTSVYSCCTAYTHTYMYQVAFVKYYMYYNLNQLDTTFSVSIGYRLPWKQLIPLGSTLGN